jgi:hypothetical protein
MSQPNYLPPQLDQNSYINKATLGPVQTVPTIKVKNEDGVEMTINESDFNPDLHERVEAPDAAPTTTTPRRKQRTKPDLDGDGQNG